MKRAIMCCSNRGSGVYPLNQDQDHMTPPPPPIPHYHSPRYVTAQVLTMLLSILLKVLWGALRLRTLNLPNSVIS